MSNLVKMLEQLGIAEIPLITLNYEIKILKETENEIVGEFKSKSYSFEFQYFLNGELYVGKKNRRLDFLKDVIKVSCLDRDAKIKLLDDCGEKYADVLVLDESDVIRSWVANHGHCLEILVDDPDCCIRMIVAEKGYGLEKLINDSYWNVRCTVARKGYGLEKLVSDEDWYIRKTVAEQGYKPEILIHDEDERVRRAASKHIKGRDVCWEGNEFIYLLPEDAATNLVGHPEAIYIGTYDLPKLNKLFKVFNKNKRYKLYVEGDVGRVQILLYDNKTNDYMLFNEEHAAKMGYGVHSYFNYGRDDEEEDGDFDSIFEMFLYSDQEDEYEDDEDYEGDY